MIDSIPMDVFNSMASQNATLRRLCLADSKTRNAMIKKPAVKDLLHIPIPYTVENVPLIAEGVHNGDFYPSSVLRQAVAQHEGLPIFLDHHNNFIGGTAQTFAGMIHEPYFDESIKSICARKVDFINEDTARAIAYGAKFGLSCTVDADTRSDPRTGNKAIFSPVFRSYSVVLDPACRETMMNENKKNLEVNSMEGEANTGLMQDMALDFMNTSSFQNALANAMVKNFGPSGMKMLMGAGAAPKGMMPDVYGYPDETKKKQDEEMAKAKLDMQTALESKKSLEEKFAKLEVDMKKLSADVETSKAENTKLSQEVTGYKAKELEAEINEVIEGEKRLGMLNADGVTARLEELKKLSLVEVLAVSNQLERTLKATENLDAVPSELGLSSPASPQQKQLGATDTAHNLSTVRAESSRKMLEMMRKAQGG